MVVKNISFIISGNGDINLIFKNRQYQIKPDSKNYKTILDVIGEKQDCTEDEFLILLNPVMAAKKHISKQINSKLVIEEGIVKYEGYVVDNLAVKRLFEFIEKDLPTAPLEAFLARVCENPSLTVSSRLYEFLEHKHLPLTVDGCFLAYKAVTSEYLSKTSGPNGRLDNHIGKTVEVPRSCVDDNSQVDCSQGLHAGTLEYVNNFGSFNNSNPDKVIIVKINPIDVVSVPDHDSTKLRTCKYIVVGECPNRRPLIELVYHDNQTPFNINEAPDEYEDEDFDDEWNEEEEEEEELEDY